METIDCKGCDHCCKWIGFGINLQGLTTEGIKEKLAYFQVHGCEIVKQTKTQYVIMVYSPCQQLLKDGDVGCRIHPIRPEICRQYDCRNDPWLPKGGNYKQRGIYNG